MSGQLYTSSELDSNGRQVVLDDDIRHVKFYSSEFEAWDKNGSGQQSWYNEIYLPNDPFDTTTIADDKWDVLDTTTSESTSTVTQGSGKLTLGVEKDEGLVALSSDQLWRITGDFDLRLYIDWDSYYNEYRSLTYTYLKVGVDSENAARLSFHFNGSSSYSYDSEKTVGRDLVFFDWKDNGDSYDISDIDEAKETLFLNITRESGVIKTYISDGETSTQVGDDISDAVFSDDVFVEFGVEAKEYNTYRSAFSKLYLVQGTVTPTAKFFSTSRGDAQAFPDKVVLAVDDLALSIIDESTSTLWMRMLFGDSPLEDSTTRVYGCNGVLYCTTSDGLVAFDFPQDKIFKYKDDTIYVADEAIALRNSGVTFRPYIENIGSIPDNNIHGVSCKTIGSQDYIAFTHDAGVAVMRPLASGVASCTDGPLPASIVNISGKGSLYWVGFDADDNNGELSYFSNVAALSGPSDISFNRTTYYNTETTVGVFGRNITSLDVTTTNSTDQIAVGSTTGITFLAFSPGASFTGSVSYGVSSPASNPISDPSFEDYLGIYWIPFVSGGFHEKFFIERSSDFSSGEGSYSLHLSLDDLPSQSYYEDGMVVGVGQDVDLTGLSALYFDLRLETQFLGSTNLWDFQILVDEDVLKSYQDQDGTFTKYNDSIDVVGYSGTHTLKFQIEVQTQSNPSEISDRKVYLDNIRTKVATPDYEILPAGNASVLEVLIQYDSQGHKIYFSTANGYGAVDLDDNSLDYFILLDTYGPDDAEVLSSDFSRIEDEV